MSSEATISSSLTITVGNYRYQSLPGSFAADVSAAGAAGPTPGSVLASLTGTTVSLANITNKGGLCRIQNTDLTNFIEVGVYDTSLTEFIPILELLPGESFIMRLSRFIGQHAGAGTGTTGSDVSLVIRVDPTQATGTTALALVEAFNK